MRALSLNGSGNIQRRKLKDDELPDALQIAGLPSVGDADGTFGTFGTFTLAHLAHLLGFQSWIWMMPAPCRFTASQRAPCWSRDERKCHLFLLLRVLRPASPERHHDGSSSLIKSLACFARMGHTNSLLTTLLTADPWCYFETNIGRNIRAFSFLPCK